VINVDPSGKIRLSRKALLQEGGGEGSGTSPAPATQSHGEGSEGGHSRPARRRER
jgi:hypothetical protein